MALSRSLWLYLALVTSSGAAKTCSVDGEECFDEEKYIEQQQMSLLQAQIQVHKADKHAQAEDLPVLPEDRAPQQMTLTETGGGMKPSEKVRYEKELLHEMMQKQAADSTLDASSLDVLDNVLKTAERLTGDVGTESALEDFEGAIMNGADASSLVVGTGKDHDKVMQAIEEESVEMSPEEAEAQNGQPITGKLLRDLNGLPETPEQAQPGDAEAGTLVEADMLVNSDAESLMLSQLASKGGRFVKNLWKNNMAIPYCFSQWLSPKAKKAFQDAVQHYRNHIPCVDFKEVSVKSEYNEKCSEEPGIYVKSNEPNSCFANVGQPGKWNGEYSSSVCHLGSGCESMGIAAHEIGHNIGMMHEQSRTDHSQYVTILWDNIQPAQVSQYKITSDADTTVPYDIMSLMHYGDDDFGAKDWNGKSKKTMLYVGGKEGKTMGNRMGLTTADAKQVARMYSCEAQLRQFTLCTQTEDYQTSVPCICNAPYIKVKKGDGYQCAKRCVDYSYGNAFYCQCPEGCTKKCFQLKGVEHCGCADCNTPAPVARPPPPPPPPPPTWTTPAPAPPTTWTTPAPAPPTPPASHTFTCQLGWEAQLKAYCANVNTYPFIAATADCSMSYTHWSASDIVSSCAAYWGKPCFLYDSYGGYSCR